MGRLKVFTASHIDDQAKIVWRGVADSLSSARKKAIQKTGFPDGELVVWEIGEDE